jgi:pantoate--beta-alanine ligase
VKIVSSLTEIHKLAGNLKKNGDMVAIVPTMGCLHEGHLSLIGKAEEFADQVILSIFINPMQFGPNEDLDAYPRQFQRDCDLAEKEGVDVIFSPDPEEMYSSSFQTTITVNNLSQGMCGEDRPGHFEGVATVVTKLLNLTLADVAVFGEKDYQQLAVVRQLVKDLNMPVQIIGAPIVREPDGLAMSSRNKYLKGEGRKSATCLYRSIIAAKKITEDNKGEIDAGIIVEQAKTIIAAAGAKLEYAVVVNAFSLKPEEKVTSDSVLAIAAKIDNKVRLIDNTKLCT